MSMLQPLGKGQGYLKAGFLGFQKSGKTFTAATLAIGTWNFFGEKGRIIFFDTESGSEYIAPKIERETGMVPLGVKSRSFSDLMALTEEIQENDILIVDSVTHPWRELCESHLDGINKGRARKKLPPRRRLEFQDWNVVKPIWETWTTWYLNSKSHVIICGRAGFEYDMQKDEETGRSELLKTGIKMKTEGEFGFEPSLLVEMERVQKMDGDTRKLVARATVLGDRFDVINGQTFDNPTFNDFLPYMKMLTPGASSQVDATKKTDTGVDEDGDTEWTRERRERDILCEEIKGLMVEKFPGQSADDKKKKQQVIFETFNTRSWTKVESLSASELRDGLALLREKLENGGQENG